MKEAQLPTRSLGLEYFSGHLEQRDRFLLDITTPTSVMSPRSQLCVDGIKKQDWHINSTSYVEAPIIVYVERDVSRQDLEAPMQSSNEPEENEQISSQEESESPSNADQPAQESSYEVCVEESSKSTGNVQDNTFTPTPDVTVVMQKTPVCVSRAADRDSTEGPEVPTWSTPDLLKLEIEKAQESIERLRKDFLKLDLAYKTKVQPTKPSVSQWRRPAFSSIPPDHFFAVLLFMLALEPTQLQDNPTRCSSGYSFSGVNSGGRHSQGSQRDNSRDQSERDSKNEDMGANFICNGPNKSISFYEPVQVQSAINMDSALICFQPPWQTRLKVGLDLEEDLPYGQPPYPLDAPPPRLSVPCQDVSYNSEATCLVSGFGEDCTHTSSKQQTNAYSSDTKKTSAQELAGFTSDIHVVSKNLLTPIPHPFDEVVQLDAHTEPLVLSVEEASVLSCPQSPIHKHSILVDGVMWFKRSYSSCLNSYL